eukprot:scaffold12862_cov164-Alexandrium_tamarense.AAC.1
MKPEWILGCAKRRRSSDWRRAGLSGPSKEERRAATPAEEASAGGGEAAVMGGVQNSLFIPLVVHVSTWFDLRLPAKLRRHPS